MLPVVVTHRPGKALDRVLRAVRARYQAVLVIDNASPASLGVARSAMAADCRFIGNPRNCGEEAALMLADGFAQDAPAHAMHDARWMAAERARAAAPNPAADSKVH